MIETGARQIGKPEKGKGMVAEIDSPADRGRV
jgi:hypothetical protein